MDYIRYVELLIIYWVLRVKWSLDTCLRMCHYSKPSYILHGHAEGQGRNRSSEPIDGILIYDKLYVCEQVAVSGLGVYLCRGVCIFTMFVCVCVYCLPYFYIDFCHYRFSKSSFYIAMIIFKCSMCFQSKCCPFINIDKAHLAVCWMLWTVQWVRPICHFHPGVSFLKMMYYVIT